MCSDILSIRALSEKHSMNHRCSHTPTTVLLGMGLRTGLLCGLAFGGCVVTQAT